MSIITLTSDFGTLDYRVAAIKGSILSLYREVIITDVTHSIQAFNLVQTAHIVRNSYKYFPKGSIHIVATDSFYHKSRKNILYKADGSYFIAADNGVMHLASAVNTPTVGLFMITEEAVYKPYNDGSFSVNTNEISID